jgi:hypothetical protein
MNTRKSPPWHSFKLMLSSICLPPWSPRCNCAGCRQIKILVRQCHNRLCHVAEPRVSPPVCFMPNWLGEHSEYPCATTKDPFFFFFSFAFLHLPVRPRPMTSLNRHAFGYLTPSLLPCKRVLAGQHSDTSCNLRPRP